MITAEQAKKLSEVCHDGVLDEKRVKEIENDIMSAAQKGEYSVRYKTLSRAIVKYLEDNGFIVVEQSGKPFATDGDSVLGFNILWGDNIPDCLTNSFYLQ